MRRLNSGLTKGYMAYLEYFSIGITGKMSNASLNGQRKSGAKGTSMEFSDFRQYTPGDDIRRIDWNSFARSDKLVTKVFLEEKQAEVNIFIDLSQSMAFDEEKAFYTKMIAASMAYIALKNNDKVNIYGWNEGLSQWRVNNTSKNNFASIVSFLDEVKYGGKTNLKEAISKAITKQTRGISIVISDFFSNDEFKTIIDELRYRKQAVSLVQVLGEGEIDPQIGGNLRLTDCETQQFKDITLNEGIVKEYKKALVNMQDNMRDYCKKSGSLFCSLNTKITLEEALKVIL